MHVNAHTASLHDLLTVVACSALLALPHATQADMAEDAYDRGDYVESLRLYRERAQNGELDAQYELAYQYLEGEGTAQDYRQAMKWFRRAAEQGHAAAQHMLGSMFLNAEGVDEDKAEAVKWFACRPNKVIRAGRTAWAKHTFTETTSSGTTRKRCGCFASPRSRAMRTASEIWR